jgi:peptidoglycan/xylan/chitin deacetylase (PgdA/CDA1 family)
MTRIVPVLMYHLVGDPAPGAPYPGLYVSAASFEAQMQALHDAGWHTITAGQLGAALAANRPVPARSIVITFDDGYTDNYTTALPILRQYGFDATFSVVARANANMMTPAELAALARAGMEIGNHTLNHRNVSRLHGAKLDLQIVGGADRIESELASRGLRCDLRTFVYPSGHVGPDAVSLLGRLGYTDAFTEVPGWAVIGQSDPLQLPRIRVSRSMLLGAFLDRLPRF